MFILRQVFKNDNYKLLKQVFHGRLPEFHISAYSVQTLQLRNLGILKTEYPEIECGMIKDHNKITTITFTPFGKVVAKVVAAKYGLECDFEI